MRWFTNQQKVATTKGQIPPFQVGSVKSALDPIAGIAKTLSSPGFLQNHSGQQQPSKSPQGGEQNKQQKAENGLSCSC